MEQRSTSLQDANAIGNRLGKFVNMYNPGKIFFYTRTERFTLCNTLLGASINRKRWGSLKFW